MSLLKAFLLSIPLAIVTWVSMAPAQSKPSKVIPKSGFLHSQHADAFDMKKCEDCHASKSQDRPLPTGKSHTPCLDSGCHIREFLNTSKRAKKEDPQAFQMAANFCSVCHQSKSGAPPSRFARAPADALYSTKTNSEFHVEMNHFEHSKRAACTTCHKVDPNSFTLDSKQAAHKICSTCHDEGKQSMDKCESCHKKPGYDKVFTKSRPASDVRECSAVDDPNRPCFKHERKEHRFDRNDKAIECSACHFMFKRKTYRGVPYLSLADVKAAPMMDNARDLAHKNCGAGGCHRREVDDSQGTGKCTLCHSNKFMASSLVD